MQFGLDKQTARIVTRYLAVLAGVTVLFQLFPSIDLWVSGWFWSPGGAWYLDNWGPFNPITQLVPPLTDAIVMAAAILLFVGYLYDWWLTPFDRRGVIYILLTILLGPGLLANTILKNHWGRARPAQILEFGGTKHFTTPLIPTDQCDTNCSFVSGHGAMAFSLVAFAFLIADPARRRRGIAAALAFGTLVGFTRIAQGRHFLSDTVYAALLMIAVAWLLHRWIIVNDGLSRPWVRAVTEASASTAERLGRLGWWVAGSRRRRWTAFHLLTLAAFVVSVIWIDRPVAQLFQTDHDRLFAVFTEITKFGLGDTWLVPTGLATIVLVAIGYSPRFTAAKERWLAWAIVPGYLFASIGAAGLAADILKILIGRTRPTLLFRDGQFTWTGLSFHANHWSLPSGHTATVAALATAMTVLWPRHAMAYALLAGLVALSRIGLDEHYVSDTIVGAWLGIMVTLYVTGVFRRSYLDLEDAKAGVRAPAPALTWRWRLLGISPPPHHSL